MGLRKHGVGQVLPEEGEPVQKTANQQDWSEEDEQDLEQEIKE